MPTQCTATTLKGTPCKAWAIPDSDPPRCAAHSTSRSESLDPQCVSSPHPLTSIQAIIDDLAAKQARLSTYIDEHAAELEAHDLKALLSLHAMTASRLGKLLRDRRALSGEAADGISDAFGKALDELATELGIDL